MLVPCAPVGANNQKIVFVRLIGQVAAHNNRKLSLIRVSYVVRYVIRYFVHYFLILISSKRSFEYIVKSLAVC